MKVLPFGDRALLVEVSDASAVADLLSFVAALPSVARAVPGARTVLVQLTDQAGSAEARDELLRFMPAGGTSAAWIETVEIPVRYDGEDLASVASMTALTVDTVIALHSQAEYRVAFCGFAPGFAYLSGLPSALHLPRLATPRTRVPAGSVAIAAEYSAVYPRPSPGGWRLLGQTSRALWDVLADPPALLRPGVAVRFIPA